MRTINKDNFDSTYKLRNDEFKIGDIILIFDSTAVINVLTSKKLNYRQIRLYRIIKSDFFKGIYRVSELDGAVLRDTYADNRLKYFHAVIVFDVSNKHGAPAFSNNRDNDIINFANAF